MRTPATATATAATPAARSLLVIVAGCSFAGSLGRSATRIDPGGYTGITFDGRPRA